MKKLNDFLSGLPMTIVSGVFLVLSFLLPKLDIVLPIDPALISVIVSGIPLLYSAVRKLIVNSGISKISSALLITIAMIAAAAIGDLFAAGEVAFIMALGGILEDMTVNRAKKGLTKLISLAPTQGRLISNGREELIPAEKIQIGDMLRILPGEAITVDGIIVSGETSVDQSVMTGESLPVDKTVGDEVFCGTLNCFGAIDIKATKVGEDSSLQRLIRLVKEAENQKAPMARIADKCASWLVPAALLIAIITGLVTSDITRAVTVLVVFCPCALVLATPTAIMAAIGQATKHGVIIKSGSALEKMGKVDTIAFDKTGTLTVGKPSVSDIIVLSDINEDRLLSLAASAESKSEHPLGKALTAHARERGTEITDPTDFTMKVGKGITAKVGNENIVCGNEQLLNSFDISLGGEAKQHLASLTQQGKACILVAANGECVGMIALSDTLREDSKSTVEKLKALDVQSVLLTGDNINAAEYFAKKVGIDTCRAELLPEDKAKNIALLESEGKTVCMIGDGINDAPALKSASVGIALGSMGSDIAVEAADIALMSDDISKLPYLKRLSNATVSTIKLSISLSMIINLLAVTLSVLGILNPTLGALVHNAGSCFVVLIAALLYDRKF